MKHFSYFFLLLGLLVSGRIQAQTELQAGQVLLLGYRTQDVTDFAFVPLVDLKAGTELKFAD